MKILCVLVVAVGLVCPGCVRLGFGPPADGAADTPATEAGPPDVAVDAVSDGPATDALAAETGPPDAVAGSDGPVPGPWHRSLGGTDDDAGVGVAVDGSGNVYITGSFSGTADLGGGNVTSMGQDDIFVTSFTAAGTHRWQKALGGTGKDVGTAVAVDSSGNVYITGRFSGTADLGGGGVTSMGQDDIFVTSFTAAGAHRWRQGLGGSASDVGRGVGVDGSGNVYVTGNFSGTAALGGGNVTSQGGDDIFVTSFTVGGGHRWQKALGCTNGARGYAVAVEGGGNVYVTGFFSGTADLGGGNVTTGGSVDVFVTSFTAGGTHRWQKALDGSGSDYAYGVAVDGSGNVYLTGSFSGTVDLGGGNVSSKGSDDVFVTSFSTTGVHRWQKALGGSSADSGSGVAVDGSGNVYLTGSFIGTADLGGGNVTSGGFYDIFVTSFTAGGTHRWRKALGGSGTDFGQDVAVDGNGNVYLTGSFSGTTDLGGGSVTSKGGYDVFVVKLGP